MSLSALAKAFINRYQGGFPLVGRPYARAAALIGTTEQGLLALIADLLAAGQLSRFGPIYDASRLGGWQTLAAMRVPEAKFNEVAETVNAFPEVAHNYRREHALNMWFVVAAASRGEVARTMRKIEQGTGLAVHDFPKQHEFYLGLWLKLGAQGEIDTMSVPASVTRPPVPMDALDRRIVAATQRGLPLVSEPLAAIGEQLEAPIGVITRRMTRMLATGAIRRVGAVPNHYRLGLRGNGMTVWDVPDELAVALGHRVGALDFVSHGYLRPRRAGIWPYNLFAMVHGRDRAQVVAKTQGIARLLAPHCRAQDVLFSTKVLKKTGLRLAA